MHPLPHLPANPGHRATDLVAWGAAALVFLQGGAAWADEGEFQLNLEPRYAMLYLDGNNLSGGGLSAQLSYGLSDTVSLMGFGVASAHGNPLGPGAVLGYGAFVGAMYTVDIVRIVPFFEAFVGVLGQAPLGTSDNPSLPPLVAFGGGVGVGGDYLVNRRLSVGVSLRYAAAFTAFTDPAALSRMPLYLLAGSRVSLRF